MNPDENIQSVARTLEVLRALNRKAVGTVRALARETGLPATTVVRILGTLENLGYVRKIGRRAGYVVAGKAVELGAGYHGYPAIHERAGPVLAGLTGRLLWPAALATLDGAAMVVRLSTIPRSPLAHAHSTLGRRLALPATAHGRAWLAFCPGEERRRLLALLAAARLPDGANGAGAQGAAELAARLAPVLCLTRGRGYAVRDPRTEPRPGPRPVPGTVTVAVPVTEGGRVVATIGLTCFSGARIELGLLAGELKAAAGQIAGRSAEPERDPADGGTAPGRRGGAGPGETGPGGTGPGGTGPGGGPS